MEAQHNTGNQGYGEDRVVCAQGLPLFAHHAASSAHGVLLVVAGSDIGTRCGHSSSNTIAVSE